MYIKLVHRDNTVSAGMFAKAFRRCTCHFWGERVIALCEPPTRTSGGSKGGMKIGGLKEP